MLLAEGVGAPASTLSLLYDTFSLSYNVSTHIFRTNERSTSNATGRKFQRTCRSNEVVGAVVRNSFQSMVQHQRWEQTGLRGPFRFLPNMVEECRECSGAGAGAVKGRFFRDYGSQRGLEAMV